MGLKRFLANTRGNVAISFALTLVPILLAAGAAIDFAHQNSTTQLLQAATDAAVLATTASHKTGNGDVLKVAKDYIIANGGLDALQSISGLDAIVTNNGGTYSVRLNGKIKTNLLVLAGLPTLDVGSYSESQAGAMGLEMALVLDNTASMASEGRIDALKKAAASLVDKVMDAQQNGMYVKVGLIPFADYVNVGLKNRSKSWMNVPADYTEVVKNVCSVSYPNAVYSNCHNAQGIWNNDGVPTPYTYQVCDSVNYGTPVTTCADQIIQHKWYGCVGSRNSPMDIGIGSLGVKYPGILDTGCTAELTPLSSDKAALENAISAMTPVGETYIAPGLLWGWNILDTTGPYTEAKSFSAMKALHGSKYIVLMTDGENTRSPVYPYHYGSDANLANSITSQTCGAIKAAGIVVYTVGFKVQAQSSKDLLTACATKPSMAFDAADDAALQASFDNIANQLVAMHLSK